MTCGCAPEVVDPAKCVFDEMAAAISLLVLAIGAFAVPSAGDYGAGAAFTQVLTAPTEGAALIVSARCLRRHGGP